MVVSGGLRRQAVSGVSRRPVVSDVCVCVGFRLEVRLPASLAVL